VLTVVDAVMQAGGDVCHLQATFTHSQILTGNVFKIIYCFILSRPACFALFNPSFCNGFTRNGGGRLIEE
jgi:hypothetical protein